MTRLVWIWFILFAAWKLIGHESEVNLGPGVKVEEAPLQTNLTHAEAIYLNNHKLTPLAEFTISAKVLSRKNYHFDRESELSPVDFALGWQLMSDETVLKDIEIKQSGRWYFWRVERFPIPRQAIETQSANMHLIPANKYIEKALDKVKQGQIINMTGALVRADSQDGWQWQSSLTRTDTGNHACEVMYVDSITVIQ
jgi:hypothetical protein